MPHQQTYDSSGFIFVLLVPNTSTEKESYYILKAWMKPKESVLEPKSRKILNIFRDI